MKRGSKILIAILFGFLIPLIATGTVQAKTMNMDELTQAIIDLEYDTDVTDVYIIGDYAFTSDHRLTLEDIMLAARSINVVDTEGRTDSAPVYGEMSILHYAGTYDADWNLTGFKYEKHLAGKTEAASSYDIKYIDYNKQYTVINVNTLVNKAYETIKKQAATDVFVVNKVSDTAMEVVLMNTEMTSIEALAGTGVATAAANFLNEEGIVSVTLALGQTKVVIDENLDQEAIENFFKALGNKAGDLVGKTLTATIAFKDGYKTENSEEFTIAFKDAAKVDVATLVDAAYTTIKNQAATDVFEVAKDGNKISVTIKNTEMTSIEALAGTGVATAAANFLNEDGVKTVTLALGEAKVVIDENLDQEAIENFFKALGNKAGDLAGKTLTATIGFEEGYKSVNATSFEVVFGTQIDVNTLVEAAYATIKGQAATDKFVVNKVDTTKMEVVLMDTEMASLDALAGTGVATAAANFLNEQGIKTVTLALGETKVVIDENLDQEAIENFFKALGTKAGDLVGKTLTATIAFEDAYTTANSKEFSIAFKGATKVDVATLVDAAYTTIKNQAATDVFEVAKDGNKISVTIKNTEMTSIEALAGTGVATAAANFLNEDGVKTVTLALGETKVVIDENLDQAAIEGFFKALGNKAGDLAGKTITATIGFEAGYKAQDVETFGVVFGTQIDVNTLVDAAYATIKGQAATDKFVVNKVDTTKMEVVLMDTEMASLDALAGTGVATAAANFLNEQGIEAVTLALGTSQITINEDLNQAAIEDFFKELGTKAGDLVGKTMTATVEFKDGFGTKNSQEFSIAFKDAEKVNVNTLVDAAYEIIKKQAATDKFVVSKVDGTAIEVVLMDTEMASLDALAGTGVATAAANFLNEEGIKTVTLALGETKVVIDENLDQAAIENFFKALGNKAEDLIGKTITAEIVFEAGYKTENSDEFTVTFKGAEKVNVDTLVSKAYTTIANQAPENLFVVTRTFNQINVTIKDTEMASLDALAGTGVATAAANFLNEAGIKTVTLALGETKVVIDENLDQEAIENFFKALGNKAGDLAGKTITATVGFEAGYETANSTSFDIVFGTLVDVNTLVDKAYETIEKQAATDKFVVNRTGATTMDVVLMDTEMASLDALAGTGVATAAANFLNEEGIAFVTLSVGQTNISINEELDQAAIEGFFKALGNKAGDLVGKTITAEIVFKAGFGTKNSEKFEVTFKESQKVDVNELANEAYETIANQAPANLFIITKQGNNIGVTIKDTEMASLDALAGTGVATAAANFLNEEGIKTVTLALGEAKVVIDENLDQAAIEGFFKALGNKAGDLAGKTITAEIAFEAGFETANSNKFEVSFGTQVDVNTMVDAAYEIIKKQAATDVFVVNRVGVTDIEVVLMDTEMASLDALAGTGVATAAANFLNEEGIKTVTLALGETKVVIDENLDQAAIEGFFKALGNKAGDLVEKEITATIAFEEGFGTKNSEEFTVVFRDSEKVDVNTLVDKAYTTIANQAPANLFVVEKDGKDINVTIKDTEMASLDALAGTGIATAAANFLNEAGIKTVTLALGETKVTIDENLDQAAIEAFFKALGNKAGDLAGKTITAEMTFEAGYETANSNKFEIRFGTQVDVNDMVNDAYETIKNQAATDVFEVNLKDATTIEVVLKDTEMESIEALAGTGVATAAANFLTENGIASVTLSLGNSSVKIDENLDQEAIETFFKELGTTAGDLVGRPMTAEIAFKDGFGTKNSQEFTILFSEAVNVNF